jgi:hypothetical protein
MNHKACYEGLESSWVHQNCGVAKILLETPKCLVEVEVDQLTIFWWLLLIFRLIGYIADTLDIDSCQILKN